jgi:hypothetical protein
MSYHPLNFEPAPASTKTEVEVILVTKTDKSLMVKVDETSRPVWISRSGVKIKANPTGTVTLTLSERKAINYNLI